MKKMVNGICVAFGFLFLGIGTVGIVLPILPTTPFVLLAAALFARGSKRFHHWFAETKLYQKYIHQAVHKKAMTARAKASVLFTISSLLLIGFLLSPIWHAKVLIGVIAVFHYYYFLFRIRTDPENQKDRYKEAAEPES